MKRPIATIAIPNHRKNADRDYCGAFYNLYRVIGDCCNGVPYTDTDDKYEWAEMTIARVRLNYCNRTRDIEKDYSYTTITDMCNEVDKFLKNFKL